MSNDRDLTVNPTDSNLIARRYRLRQQLGKGTFGVVYQADDLKFQPPRAVALKLLHNKLLNEAEVRSDIEKEASVLARFSHPNILRILDFEISESQAFIVTELAEGGSLARKIRPDPAHPPVAMPMEEVARYLDQICEALDEAHAAGLVHRDLKPLNILLDKRGRPLVADFGLATALNTSQSSVLVDASASGTPPYMAPEQWLGHAGKASDIYALGVITYQLITGQLPFQGDQSALAFQHLQGPIPKLSDRAAALAYPPALDEVIAGALAKDPRQRTKPASEFSRSFKEVLGLSGPVVPRPLPNSSLAAAPNVPGPAYNQTGPANPTQPPWPQANSQTAATQIPYRLAGQPGLPYQVTEIPGRTPGFTPVDSTQIAGLPNSPTAYDSTRIANPPSANLQNGNGYAPTQVIGPNPSYGPVPQPGPVTPSFDQAQPASPAKAKKNNPVLFGILGLVLIIVVGAIAFLAITANTAKPAAPTLAAGQPSAGAGTGTVQKAAGLTSPVLLKTLAGHSKTVQALAFSPDGRTLAVGTLDRNITLWEVASGKEIKTLTSDDSVATNLSLMYSPDGKNLAAGYYDVPLALWDTASGKVNKTLSTNNDGSRINAVAFSPNGTIIIGADGRNLKMWEVATGKLIKTFTGHTETVRSVAFSPDGKSFISGSADKTIKIWDLTTAKEAKTLNGHTDIVMGLAYSPDGLTFVSGSADKTIKLWEAASGNELKTFAGHAKMVNSVAYSPDGKTLASGSADGTNKLWDIASGKVLSSFNGHDDSIIAVAFGPDGKILASGHQVDQTVELWQLG